MTNRFSRHLWLLPWICLAIAAPALAEPRLVSVQSVPALGPVLGAQAIPAQTVILRAQLAGRVKYLAGPAGTPVRRGEVVSALDTGALLAQRAQAEAAYVAAEVAIHNAYAQYHVQEYNYGGGNPWNPFAWFGQGMAAMMGNSQNPWATYLANLDNRRATALQAQSHLLSAAWRIRELDADIRDAYGVSPFYGVILQKEVNVGDVVQPGQPLLVLGVSGPAQVRVQVPTAFSNDLQLGSLLTVRSPENPAGIPARILEVSPQANAKTHTIAVKLALPADATIRAGEFVTVQLPSLASSPTQLAIPRSALLPGRSLPSVLVDEHGVTELRVVRLGEPLANGEVQVLAGLKAGDIVVDNPPAGVGSGYHLATLPVAEAGEDQ